MFVGRARHVGHAMQNHVGNDQNYFLSKIPADTHKLLDFVMITIIPFSIRFSSKTNGNTTPGFLIHGWHARENLFFQGCATMY